KYDKKMTVAEDILKDIDITDSPFLALALALNCSIWSNDGHFKQQDKGGYQFIGSPYKLICFLR
ncbi:MAG: PIN domain-containing protein, partial [Candidatus Methanoperedens sp.]|nr:PIN domain-containing protein [Candidatus Methanoperedens sp.]